MHDLLTLRDALEMKRKKTSRLFSEYVNPGMGKLFSRYGFERRFIKAKGMYVVDEDNRTYLDFLGGYGALNYGHNPDFAVKALSLAAKFPNFLQAGVSSFQAVLAYNLSKIIPGNLKITYFSSSGSEAVEFAVKISRAYTGKKYILYNEGAYHGITSGALSITDNDKYKKGFIPSTDHTNAVPYADINALERKLSTGNYAAYIFEPVQGESGMIVPPEGYLKKAQEISRKNNVLFIADEIQTGFGRTGKNFACEHDGLTPDIITLAKSLGAGIMPIGATLIKEEIWKKVMGDSDSCTTHSSTFGGNTWACVCGIEAVNYLIRENISQRTGELGEYFLKSLRSKLLPNPNIKDIRGIGLMIGIEFTAPNELKKQIEGKVASIISAELLNKHNIITAYALNKTDVLRLEPPLIVTKEEIDKVILALSDLLSSPFSIHLMLLKAIARMAKSFIG